MQITFDPAKRDETFVVRGLDFEDAADEFAGVVVDIPDLRRDYGESRVITLGSLRGRMVVVVWTATEGGRGRIISMRKANDREQQRFGQRLGEE